MKKASSSIVMMARSGRPVEAVIAAPDREGAEKPASRACNAAIPLCVPGIWRMPGLSRRSRKRAPAGLSATSLPSRYTMVLSLRGARGDGGLATLMQRHKLQVLRADIIRRRADNLVVDALFHHMRRPS